MRMVPPDDVGFTTEDPTGLTEATTDPMVKHFYFKCDKDHREKRNKYVTLFSNFNFFNFQIVKI